MNFSLPAISLRHKIVLAILLTTIAALAASTLAIYLYEKNIFRRTIENDLRTQAQLVADFAASAIVSGDKFSARQRLETLKIRPRVEQACLYTADGKPFAEYDKENNLEPPPPLMRGDKVQFAPHHASIFLPVKLKNNIVGAIFLRMDLQPQLQQWRNRLYIVGLVGLIVVALSFILSLQFQGMMTVSLLALTNTARAVTAKGDYNVRAPRISRDEIGEVATAFNQMLAHISESMAERRKLEEEILRISENERARIGQDIHDGLCQQLVGVTFVSKLLQEQLKAAHPQGSVAAGEIIRLLQDAINQARDISHALYPAHIAEEGLCGAIEHLASQINATSGIRCHLHCEDHVILKDNLLSLHLYRIAQESLNNAVKHAKPQNITIRMTHADDHLELAIEDDGRGIPDDGHRSGGMGLKIMRYRANMLGGTLSIKRRPEGGTIVSCRCPFSS